MKGGALCRYNPTKFELQNCSSENNREELRDKHYRGFNELLIGPLRELQSGTCFLGTQRTYFAGWASEHHKGGLVG